VTKQYRYQRPWLYPQQQDAIFALARIVIIEATTKCGKTFGCLVWLFERAICGRRGDQFWWVAPVQAQAHMAFERARRSLPPRLFRVNQTRKTIQLANGAVICFKSADAPDSLYGEDVRAAVIDEAARCKEEVWPAIRSTLTATRGPSESSAMSKAGETGPIGSPVRRRQASQTCTTQS
jgi:phage terminase large subunit-like protein